MTRAQMARQADAVPKAPIAQRLAHPLKRRLITVLDVTALVPDSLLITFTGQDLQDFVTLGFDDHIKLFFPMAGNHVHAKTAKEFCEEHVIASRHFTPRRFDPSRRELQIQFYLHGDGPAASWARQARPGDQLVLGGPKSSRMLLATFDWILLFGDETALPAIERFLEESAPWQRLIVVLLTQETSQRISLQTAAQLTTVRVARSRTERPLSLVMGELGLPVGRGLVWAAGEASDMAFMERHFVMDRGMDPDTVLTAAYWHLDSTTGRTDSSRVAKALSAH